MNNFKMFFENWYNFKYMPTDFIDLAAFNGLPAEMKFGVYQQFYLYLGVEVIAQNNGFYSIKEKIVPRSVDISAYASKHNKLPLDDKIVEARSEALIVAKEKIFINSFNSKKIQKVLLSLVCKSYNSKICGDHIAGPFVDFCPTCKTAI